MAYVLLALTILLIAFGQIAQKLASHSLSGRVGFAAAIRILALAPAFWASAVLMGAGLVVWLMTLSAIEVSKAYPVLSISFAITGLLSRVVLKEHVSRRRWIGIFLVSAGAAIMLAAP